ncbi:hypothetical protein ACFWBR_42480 [Streptomyces sp. NPDC060006]|uniref:hypothetical protein n=1 Tax=unclassified Streptomyces TaxID=2593676 RepID=UPI0036B9C935
MTAPSEPTIRLAQYLERRIAELALEYAEVCRRAEISDETLIKIRKGHKPRGSTYRKLERALEWQQGSIAAILAGEEPVAITPRASSPGSPTPPAEQTSTLSPAEALRRVVRSSAQELGVTGDDLDEVFEAVRRDLDATASTGRTDLSDLVREGRRAARLSLAQVATSAVDPESGENVVDADWLDRLERAALHPSEYPEYPQLDALVGALHLDPGLVQEAAGVQFMNVHTTWSEDGEVRALTVGELDGEDLQKVQRLMAMYRKAPRRDG